jgi:putative ABC transport system ATP-binding protein
MTALALAVRGLHHPAGARPLVLPALDLAPGARLVVRGPSGSGKTTLLRLIAGELSPAAGELRVGGAPWSALPADARRAGRFGTIGVIPQELTLIDWLDAWDNLCLGWALGARPQSAGMEARAAALVAALGLPPLRGRAPRTLSMGERQRLVVARALLPGPGLVVADEPTSALDPAGADAVDAALRASGATAVVATHDPRLAGDDTLTLPVGP